MTSEPTSARTTADRITERLQRNDMTALDAVTSALLASLWEEIKDRRLGMYGVPSPIEDAAARAFGIFRGNLQRALLDAEEEFPDPTETWGQPILAILRAANRSDR